MWNVYRDSPGERVWGFPTVLLCLQGSEWKELGRQLTLLSLRPKVCPYNCGTEKILLRCGQICRLT